MGLWVGFVTEVAWELGGAGNVGWVARCQLHVPRSLFVRTERTMIMMAADVGSIDRSCRLAIGVDSVGSVFKFGCIFPVIQRNICIYIYIYKSTYMFQEGHARAFQAPLPVACYAKNAELCQRVVRLSYGFSAFISLLFRRM